jgi:hypothetical protein
MYKKYIFLSKGQPMITPVLYGIWRWCPVHRMIERMADFRKGPAMVEANYKASASRHRSAREGESTLLPMLITGLVAVVVGIALAACFV